MSYKLEELTGVIAYMVDMPGEEEEAARAMAETALGFFGFRDRIIDNILLPEDRNLFYMFEDYNLMVTESEETILWDGRGWRIHYWKFKETRKYLPSLVDPNYDDVYADMPEEYWTARSQKASTE